MLAEGKSNKDIADLLNLSLYTVETHRRNLQDKLNLHSFAELVLYAVRKGVISLRLSEPRRGSVRTPSCPRIPISPTPI